jgi:hypothetical protein
MIYRGPGYAFSRWYDLTPPHRVLTPQTPRRQVEIIGVKYPPPPHWDRRAKCLYSTVLPRTALLLKTILIVISPEYVTYPSKRFLYKTIILVIILED